MTRSILLLLALLPFAAQSQPFHWTTYTSTSNTVDLISFEGAVWTATSGGITAYDASLDRFEVYTNTRGLGMNSCTAVGHDEHGWIWAALTDGRITRINPENGQVRQIVALEGEVFKVNRILSYGSSVFIAANNGIYRFEYRDIPDNYVVIESIKVLGGFPSEAEVNDVAVFDGHIYAATVNGLAYADVSNELLSAPASWTNITTTLFLAGPTYTFRYNGTEFITSIQFNNPVVDFAETNEGVFAATELYIFKFTGATWLGFDNLIEPITGLTAITLDGQMSLVVGVGDGQVSSQVRAGGIVLFDPDSSNEPIHAPGIGGNQVSDVKLDDTGRLWVSTISDRKGISIFDGAEWKSILKRGVYNHEYFTDDPKNIVFDNQGSAWISSEGGGVLWTDGDSIQVFDQADTTGFDVNGARLRSISSPTLVITRVARNERGDIFISNRIGGSASGPALARVSAEWIAQGNHPEPWEYFYPPAIVGSSAGEVGEILIDNLDRVWIGATGSVNDNTHVLIDRGAVSDTTDDEWFSFNPRNFQDGTTCFPDIQPDILCWAVDKQNYLWIGTESGAFYLQGGVPYTLSNNMNFICLYDMPVGRRVNDIYVDSQDNKWFATDEGVIVLDNNFAWIHVFQTATSIDNPSMLTSNSVTSITSNPLTGEFWIGTQDGLSHLTTPYLSKSGDLDEVWPYPNPFTADGTKRLFIDPERLGGKFDEARVFTITGRLVRKLTWTDMTTRGWDGRNDDGVLVAGGVYLIVTTSADGHSATGKVAVLGR
jgi:ligand-binding sensor domain-containing protein